MIHEGNFEHLSTVIEPSITVLMGMIGSGKSTYAARMATLCGAIIVNNDAFTLGLHGGNYDGYQPELKPLYQAIMATAVSTSLSLGKGVLIDGLANTANRRRKWLEIARDFRVRCQLVIFPKVDAAIHAYRRAHHDARGYTFERWLKVAKEHESEWEDYNPSEGFDVVYRIKDARFIEELRQKRDK